MGSVVGVVCVLLFSVHTLVSGLLQGSEPVVGEDGVEDLEQGQHRHLADAEGDVGLHLEHHFHDTEQLTHLRT